MHVNVVLWNRCKNSLAVKLLYLYWITTYTECNIWFRFRTVHGIVFWKGNNTSAGCICVRTHSWLCDWYQVSKHASPVYLHHHTEQDITWQHSVTHVLQWLHFRQADCQHWKMTPHGWHWHPHVLPHHLHRQLLPHEINQFWVWHRSVTPFTCWFLEIWSFVLLRRYSVIVDKCSI